MTFEEAMIKIQALPEPSRSMALDILKTGLRVHETYKVQGNQVVGKGGKTRTIYGKIRATAARSTFSRHLAQIGLKPHTLRKLWATRLADKGASLADLMKAGGWSSISSVTPYLQGKDDNRLEALIKKAVKG